MRRVALTLTLTASVALGLTPALAVEKTVHLPVAHCQVTVTTYDASLSARWLKVTFEGSGRNSVYQNCVTQP